MHKKQDMGKDKFKAKILECLKEILNNSQKLARQGTVINGFQISVEELQEMLSGKAIEADKDEITKALAELLTESDHIELRRIPVRYDHKDPSTFYLSYKK